MNDYDHPIDWADWSDEKRSRWMTEWRRRRQASRQSRVSVEERVEVYENRKTTLYCTQCGEEHEGFDHELNYCRACGESL
jgi:hypothetical protein